MITHAPLGIRRAGHAGHTDTAAPGGERPISVVATLTDRSAASGTAWDRPPADSLPEVSCVEVRADLAGEIGAGALRSALPGAALLYTLRSDAEGGGCADPAERRQDRYAVTETRLTATARAAGHRTIDGREMTLAELSCQFHRMAGQHIPVGIVRVAQTEFMGAGDSPKEHSDDR
ncbi:MAG: hypothetical protein ACRDOO_01700 [Actinomadura sp.]